MHHNMALVASGWAFQKPFHQLSGQSNSQCGCKTNWCHKRTPQAPSNLDLEMMGLFLQWLVLEKYVDLAHTHVTCWCNNMPTIAWASKLLASKAVTAACIICILALCMMACKASPLTTLHVPGTMNKMADFALQSFDHWPHDHKFLIEFKNCFALPQNACWLSC